MAVIQEIFQLLSNGTRVIYITGNHDEILRRYSDLQLGNFQLTDKIVIEINGKMTWVFHGDVFDHTTKDQAKLLDKTGKQWLCIPACLQQVYQQVDETDRQEKTISLQKNNAGV